MWFTCRKRIICIWFSVVPLQARSPRPTWECFRPELCAVAEPLPVRPDDAGGDGSVGADLQAEIKGRKRKEYFSNFPSSDWTGCQSPLLKLQGRTVRASDARKKRWLYGSFFCGKVISIIVLASAWRASSAAILAFRVMSYHASRRIASDPPSVPLTYHSKYTSYTHSPSKSSSPSSQSFRPFSSWLNL